VKALGGAGTGVAASNNLSMNNLMAELGLNTELA
jgi:hypothetical protein